MMPLVIVTIVVSYGGSLLCFMFLRRKLRLPRVSRLVLVILGTLYGVTWAFGVPQLHSDLTTSEVNEYKRLKAEGNRVWESHPYIRFFVSIPIAPGIILSYHEYQLAGLYGEGTWDVHAWYGAGTRRLFGVGAWVS
jgi:hypothetical protein